MAKIRKWIFLDFFHLKKIVSVLKEEKFSAYSNDFTVFPFNFLQDLLPFKFKKLPESYVIKDNNELKGVISLQAQKGNPYKWKITKYYLKENAFDYGSQLLDFVISLYGAKGANTFYVKIDAQNQDLLELFSNCAGFRQCSSEDMMELDYEKFTNSPCQDYLFRPFKKSDSIKVAEINNDLIHSPFKQSLSKNAQEYYDDLFKGMSRISSIKYVIESKSQKKIIGYFRIATDDNYNYCLEYCTYQPFFDCFDNVINFSISQIKKRRKNFKFFIMNKKYQTISSDIEEKIKNKSELIQSKTVMVKDYYKKIEENVLNNNPAIFFNELRSINKISRVR